MIGLLIGLFTGFALGLLWAAALSANHMKEDDENDQGTAQSL